MAGTSLLSSPIAAVRRIHSIIPVFHFCARHRTCLDAQRFVDGIRIARHDFLVVDGAEVRVSLAGASALRWLHLCGPEAALCLGTSSWADTSFVSMREQVTHKRRLNELLQ